MFRALTAISLLLASCAAVPPKTAPAAPTVAYHQHLISPAFAAILGQSETYDSSALVRDLDSAGIQRGVVLSMGYTFGDERKKIPDSLAKTREENDWTSVQVTRFPSRLVGFCSVNPLLTSAVGEIERCLRLPGMRGVKMHFGNSGVDVLDSSHVARVTEVFRTADRLGAPIVVHMRARSNTPYGRAQGMAFLADILPAAPHVVVQIAHLGGSGPGFDPEADAALDPIAAAVEAKDPRARNLFFDITTVVSPDASVEELALVARRIRQIGTQRILFGSDLPLAGNPPPGEAWNLFTRQVPLSEHEFQTIATNAPPYDRVTRNAER
jgi:predicted TIM-barrel fold metal-dependent hydrolase